MLSLYRTREDHTFCNTWSYRTFCSLFFLQRTEQTALSTRNFIIFAAAAAGEKANELCKVEWKLCNLNFFLVISFLRFCFCSLFVRSRGIPLLPHLVVCVYELQVCLCIGLGGRRDAVNKSKFTTSIEKSYSSTFTHFWFARFLIVIGGRRHQFVQFDFLS